MSYTDAAALLGHGTVAAEAIDAWFTKHGQCPAGLGAAIVAECAAAGINHDLVAAQTALESGYWTSAIAHDKNNPAGIGAENDDPYGKAITFSTVAAGIHGQLCHLLSYVKGNGPWGAEDPRFTAVQQQGWLGSVKVLRDLNGKWAFPGTSYGADIATWANALLDFANNGTWGPAMAGDDARFTWRPDGSEFGYPQEQHGRAGFEIELGVIHITAGNDSLQWLLDNHGSSSHYLTDYAGRPRAQMISEADAAWTGGSKEYNCRGIHIEKEKRSGEAWSDDEYVELARSTYPIWKRNNIPLVYLARDNAKGKRGLIGHADIPNPIGPSDPNYCGPWGGSDCHIDPTSLFNWPRYIAELQQLDGPPAPGPDDRILVAGNPSGSFGLQLGFKGRMVTIGQAISPNDVTAGILSVIGWPQEDEWVGIDGCSYQTCERAVLQYTPDVAGPWDIVLMHRGAALPARKP